MSRRLNSISILKALNLMKEGVFIALGALVVLIVPVIFYDGWPGKDGLI